MKNWMKKIKAPHAVVGAVLAWIIFIASSATALAASEEETSVTREKSGTSQAQQLEPMTVVDESTSMREDLKPDSLTNIYRIEASSQVATEVFSRQDIEDLQPKDLNDLIGKASGIDVTYQGRKSPYFIRQRGGGSFTYIIDGAVLPPSTNRILYKIPLTAIEELKIVRGATSLTLGPSIPIGSSNSGSGTNTGFIIIRTKRPEKTEASLTTSAEKATGGHPVAYSASLYAGTRIEGSSNAEGYVGALLSTMERSSKDRWFDGQSGDGGMANAGFQLGKLDINMMGYTDEGRFEMQRGIDEEGNLDDAKWYYDPLKVTVFSADGSLEWSANQTTLLNAFKTEYEQYEHNGSFVSEEITDKEYTEETSGFGLRHNARIGSTLLQVGGQVSNSTGFGPNTNKSYSRYDTTVSGFSASAEQTLMNGDLVLDGGYRRDVKHIDNSSSSSGKGTSTATDTANNDVDMAPAKVYAFGAHWLISKRLTMDGRYYRGDQGTSGDFDMRLEDDATPHPEKQERIEVALGADIVSFFNPVLTWFDVDTKNEKSASSSTYELDGGTYYYYTESDELRQGLELTVTGDIGKNTSYKFSWTHMIKNESTSDGETTDAIGVSTPEDLFGVTIKHKWRAYRAALTVKQVDEWTATSSARGYSETGGLGGYTRVDANVARDFSFSNTLMSVSLYGRNLCNDHYSTRYVTGYYPDRGLTIGTEITLSY